MRPASLAFPNRITNLAPYLPGLLTVEHQPMSLRDHFYFASLYSTTLPREFVVQAGRSVGKTQSVAGRIIVESATTKGHKTLVVTPLQEQSDTLSVTVFRPLVHDSPIRVMLRTDAQTGSVRRHDFENGALIYFSYAFLDATRVRSKHVRWLYIDELQDMDPAHLPVIDQCLSHWRQPVTFKSGTSKTKDTSLALAFEESSQGIWHIRCPRFPCDRDNVCCVEGGHLLDMIGPYRHDICEAAPGLVCSKCRKPLNPRSGRWVHRRPELVDFRFGIHVPQPIVPVHYAEPAKWRELLEKMAGRGTYTTGKFYNEVLGEPYDQAYKLFSIDDLKAAAKGVGPNDPATTHARAAKYITVILGVDWGGGGEDGVSRTKIAAAGLKGDGTVEIFYGAQFPPTMDSIADARDVLTAARLCRAKVIAHDYNGVGLPAEAAMTHFGWPSAQIAPMYYMANLSGDMVAFHTPAGVRARGFYVMDKGKTFKYLSMAVRALKVRFFDYDIANRDTPGLLNDFLCLVENLIEGTSRNTYTVRRRNKTDSDDFANAVNYATSALWEYTRTWPDLTRQGWSHGTPGPRT